MTLGNTIAHYRKQKGLTQEALAQQLEVTNQAVSKWESDQCCPDILLLPRIADIFEISIDALFGREPKSNAEAKLPWEDDKILRAVLYVGHTLVAGHEAAEKIEFCYEGPALNIRSDFSVSCGDVEGDVTASGNVTCDDVSGSIQAKGNVTCDDVDGDVSAGGNVNCDSIDGSVNAGGNVTCDEICGSSICAGGTVRCDHWEE